MVSLKLTVTSHHDTETTCAVTQLKTGKILLMFEAKNNDRV